MSDVKSILKAKSSNTIFSVPPETSVLDAIKLMCYQNVTCLLVTVDGNLVGIFTERDYIRKLIVMGKRSNDTRIGEVMTPNPISVQPNNNIDECMRIMNKNQFRHLPVVEQGKLIGVVSIGDLVQEIIEEKNRTIGYLEQYIQQT